MFRKEICYFSFKWQAHCLVRVYCSNKNNKPIIENIVIEKDNLKSKLLKQQHASTKDSFQSNNLKEIFKQILLEKAKDADLQSRLTKECKTLLNVSPKPTNAVKSVFIKLDKKTLNDQCPSVVSWETYEFDHKIYKSTSPNVECNIINKQPSSISTKTEGNNGNDGKTLKSNRLVRQEPGKVILGFIPIEWWYAFIPKTGVTGFGTFLISLGTFLVSKEYYVLEHEFYSGLSMMLLWYFGIKYTGPYFASYLDKNIDDYEKSLNQAKEQDKQNLEYAISNEMLLQYQNDGLLMLTEAKRENVNLQLEKEYRRRQMHVYNKVMNCLDYHVEVDFAKKKIQHKNLITYVTAEVMKSLTPDMQDQLINYSIDSIVRNLDKNEKT